MARHIWEWFLELHSARGSNGFSSNPIEYTQIKAWSELTGASPEPWEIKAIKSMDNALLEELAKDG